jgi:hypothetical protein
VDDTIYIYLEDIGHVRVCTDENNNILPIGIVKSHLADQYSGYGLIEKDIALCIKSLDTLTFLNLPVDDITSQSLWFFFIITYAKCFSKGEGRKIKLDKNSLQYYNEAEKKGHKEIIDLRNKYVSHSGFSIFEKNPIALTRIITGNGSILKLYDNLVYMSTLVMQYHLYSEMLRGLLKYVLEKKIKLKDKLYEEVSKNYDEDEFNRCSILPNSKELIKVNGKIL